MPERTIQINPTPKFIPAHTRGDRDFSGNGPKVFVSAWLRVVNQNQLWVRVYMKAEETEADWTTAEGSTNYMVYNGQLVGVSRITRIITDTYTSDRFEDDDHDDDVLEQGANELVNRFVVTGDTGGDDAGIGTGVTVHFNPIRFEYEPLPDDPNIVTIYNIDPTPMFVPEHVEGDEDFSGNGPIITVTASISVENNNEIWARIWMRAIETRPDFTEAVGDARYLLHRHDRRIIQIISGIHSQTGPYEDMSHQMEIRPPDAPGSSALVNEFRILGDTRGDEAGIRTGVEVHFNPITFRQEP